MRASSRLIPVDSRWIDPASSLTTQKNRTQQPNNPSTHQPINQLIMKLNQSIKTILPLAAFAGLALATSANASLYTCGGFQYSNVGDGLDGEPDGAEGIPQHNLSQKGVV